MDKSVEMSHYETDKKLDELEQKLRRVYGRAQIEIDEKAQKYFDQFKKADEAKRKLVDEGKLSPEEYKGWRKNKLLYGKRFTQLKEQIAEECANANKTAFKYINGELPEVYALNYNALSDAVEGVGGYSFTLTDANTVKFLATTDESLLPYKDPDAIKGMLWDKKQIQSEVLQGILQGEPITDIAKRLQKIAGMEKSNALTNARTMITGAENRGRLDSMKRAQKDGIILQKEWISSDQPGRTREWHLPRSFEHLVVDVDEPFVNGRGEIMYPGDPSAHPANVYNCRCTLGYVIKGFKKVK